MGLAISVNYLAWLKVNEEEGCEQFKQQLAEMNTLLESESLPTHIEPETIFELKYRGHLGSFPYQWFHYLRRVVAYWENDELFTPCIVSQKRMRF